MTRDKFANDDDEVWRQSRSHLNPAQIDQGVRSALNLCSMMIRPSNRSPAEVEIQFRRIVDRAIRDMHEDEESFN